MTTSREDAWKSFIDPHTCLSNSDVNDEEYGAAMMKTAVKKVPSYLTKSALHFTKEICIFQASTCTINIKYLKL